MMISSFLYIFSSIYASKLQKSHYFYLLSNIFIVLELELKVKYRISSLIAKKIDYLSVYESSYSVVDCLLLSNIIMGY